MDGGSNVLCRQDAATCRFSINMDKLTNLTASLKGIRYGDALRPSRDWLMLLTIALLLLVGSIAWNLWTFSEVTKGDPIGNEAPPASTDTGVIDSAARLFEERRAEEARYHSEYRFVDPSSATR